MQASIQGDAVRVTGAKRDDLQGAIALLQARSHRAAAGLQQLPGLTACAGAACCLATALALPPAAPPGAQSVTLAGSMGSKALLVIDGQPHTLAVGQSAMGVTLLQLGDGQAQVQRDGSTRHLAPGRGAGAADGYAAGGDHGAGDRAAGRAWAGTS